MPTRWMRDTWLDALSRLDRWSGEVAVSWAEAPNRAGEWMLLGATIRGGTTVGDIEYRYETLRVRSHMQPANYMAHQLREGRILRSMGNREFREIQATEGQVLWLTSGTVYTMTAPFVCPSYYASVNIADMDLVSNAQLSQPAFGPHQPYYPSGTDALLDVLYGVTQDQGRRDNFNQIVIHLPYTNAYINGCTYIDGEGMVVSLAEGQEGSAAGHELQSIWKVQASERTFRREARTITGPGKESFPVDAEPHYFSASLQDGAGLLVDMTEYQRRYEAIGELVPLPADALPEAFDFLASVWQNVTGSHLFTARRIAAAAELGAVVATREDFSSRMSALGDVLKAIEIDDSLLDPSDAKELRKDASLGRMKAVATRRLASPDLDVAIAAIRVIQDVVSVRTALQHGQAKTDLPSAFAKLGILYPVEWSTAWEMIRKQTVAVLRDLRRALESASL